MTATLTWITNQEFFNMPRLSIDITNDEHQKLKAIAALNGQSIKDYVLEQSLGSLPDISGQGGLDALKELEDFLIARKKEADQGRIVKTTAQDIFAQTLS